MKNRSASLLVLVVSASLISFGQGPRDSHRAFHPPVKDTTSHAALAKWSARMKSSNPAPTNIGFLSAPQIPAGGYAADGYFPPVVGDFNGDGNKDAATVVHVAGAYQISVVLGNGNGTFQAPKLTTTTAAAADPIWVGSLNPSTDKCDDLIMGHNTTPAATFDVWLSNCDGTFTKTAGSPYQLGTTSFITWGTLYATTNSGNLDVVIADGANSMIWTATGNGDGTFNVQLPAMFSPAISPHAPVAFADFDGDGILDFAATAASNNQDEVFFGKSGGGYTAPTLLQNTAYDSCFDAAGILTTGSKVPDIVAAGANCNPNDLLANELSVYV